MKHLISIAALLLFSIRLTFACDCECLNDCSFSVVSKNSKFVALVKVISYDDFLEYKLTDDRMGKMPLSMSVEILTIYKGTESRKVIKIWGDDGSKCRPYTSNFKIGEFYLIAPNRSGSAEWSIEDPSDYEFFSCSTDYLQVNMDEGIAYGEYSKEADEILLSKFESELKN